MTGEELRASYLSRLVEASSRGHDAALAYHADHLLEYWDRWIGFIEVTGGGFEPMISNKMFLMIEIASDLADQDVSSLECVGAEIKNAWNEYCTKLKLLQKKPESFPDSTEACRHAIAVFQGCISSGSGNT